MSDENKKTSLTPEEIKKAVSMGQPEYPEAELCEDHYCDKNFKCSEPFTDLTKPQSREQNCFENHGCTPDHDCSKPFTCSGEHMVGGDWDR